MLNEKGFSLIELLIVTVIGVFIMEAGYLLYAGSTKLFKDVKTISDNVQTEVPTVEQIGRYFDRWGVNVLSVTGSDCSTYPPSDPKCITKTAQTGLASGVACDEVTFWGNLYGTGFIKDASGTTADLVSCRLSNDSQQNCYYLWSGGAIVNDVSGGNTVTLALSGLNPNNADCSGLSSSVTANASANKQLNPTSGASPSKTVNSGDILMRAPHKIRLYCAANGKDASQNWLYADLTDTAGDCGATLTSLPVAPVNRFQVALLTDASGFTTAAQVDATFRSQSQTYSRKSETQAVKKVFGR